MCMYVYIYIHTINISHAMWIKLSRLLSIVTNIILINPISSTIPSRNQTGDTFGNFVGKHDQCPFIFSIAMVICIFHDSPQWMFHINQYKSIVIHIFHDMFHMLHRKKQSFSIEEKNILHIVYTYIYIDLESIIDNFHDILINIFQYSFIFIHIHSYSFIFIHIHPYSSIFIRIHPCVPYNQYKSILIHTNPYP